MRIWNRITGDPWAITESALHTILEIAARENERPEAVAAKLGRELQNTYQVTEREGVAILPITGPLFRYANLFTKVSGASSYELIARDFTAALENPQIKAIILDIDSPGGEVNGVSELSNMIFEARGGPPRDGSPRGISIRGKKPIIAYASGDAASGAYWIASAADEIVVSETAALGSIGVVAIYRGKGSKTPGYQTQSTDDIEIVSSQSPHKRLDPATDEGRARLQVRIDSMAEVFIEAIARNRRTTAHEVKAHFGRGDVLIGAQGVQVGLADRVGSLEKLIAEFSVASNCTPAPLLTQEKKLMDIETLKQEHPEWVAQLRHEAATAEKQRLRDILNSEGAKAHEPLAKEIAFNTDLGVQEALQLLTCIAEKVRVSTSFERVMANIPNPEITPSPDDSEPDVEVLANRIASSSQPFTNRRNNP